MESDNPADEPKTATTKYPLKFIPNTLFSNLDEFDHSTAVASTSSSSTSSIKTDLTLPHSSRNSLKMKAKHKMPHRNVVPYQRNIPNERKLRLAASLSKVEMLINLLESGTDPNNSDDYQRSALHLAASRGNIDVVTQLLKYGANPNQKDLLGNTPLHLAVCSASVVTFNKVVHILVRGGASVHSQDRMGKTPVDLARSKLALMRSRCVYQTQEITRMIYFLIFMKRAQKLENQKMNDDEISELEKKLQNLSTSEVEDTVNQILDKTDTNDVD